MLRLLRETEETRKQSNETENLPEGTRSSAAASDCITGLRMDHTATPRGIAIPQADGADGTDVSHDKQQQPTETTLELSFYRISSSTRSTKISVGTWVVVSRMRDMPGRRRMRGDGSATGEGKEGCKSGRTFALVMDRPPKSSQVPPSGLHCVGQVVQFNETPMNVVVALQGCLQAAPWVVRRCLSRKHKWLWRLDSVGNITDYQRSMRSLKRVSDFGTQATPLLDMLVHSHGHHKSLVRDVDGLAKIEQAPPHDISGDSILCSPQGPVHTHQHTSTSTNGLQLNASQRRAVEAALSQRITLIHGPPGTGKTSVVCEVVTQAVRANIMRSRTGSGSSCITRRMKTLVVAETNIAVDNVLRRLLKTTDLVLLRLGNLSSVSSDLVDTTLEMQLRRRCRDAGREATFRVAGGGGTHRVVRDNRAAQKILNAAEVVFATCSGAGDPLLAKSSLLFDLVLLDEATMSTEPSTLNALVYGARQLVLIGDPQQLAPTLGLDCTPKHPQASGSTSQLLALRQSGTTDSNDTGAEEFKGDSPLQEVGDDQKRGTLAREQRHHGGAFEECKAEAANGDGDDIGRGLESASPQLVELSTTLFHRLHDALNACFLDTQHRMHPGLAEFPSQEFYDGKLMSGVQAEDRIPPDFPWPDRTR